MSYGFHQLNYVSLCEAIKPMQLIFSTWWITQVVIEALNLLFSENLIEIFWRMYKLWHVYKILQLLLLLLLYSDHHWKSTVTCAAALT